MDIDNTAGIVEVACTVLGMPCPGVTGSAAMAEYVFTVTSLDQFPLEMSIESVVLEDCNGDPFVPEIQDGSACTDVESVATGTCDDGADNDCDSAADCQDTDCLADPACQCQDSDGDGYGDPGSLDCTHPEEDCDDGDPAVHPGADEICDGKDNNCDGALDEGCDDDRDSFCDGAMVFVKGDGLCSMGGGDCDDTDPKVNPGHLEIKGNGVDDDCDGQVDEGCFVGVLK